MSGLRTWSKWRYATDQYWIGYKVLQNAYKLANGYFLQKSFIESDYKIMKRKFIKNNCVSSNKKKIFVLSII